jgi:nitrous oxide reductase accessory protein NosL
LGLLFWLAAVPAWSDSAPGKGPVPAKYGLTMEGELRLSKTDRCPVCGMFPARRPKHAAAMVLKDGRTFYFCSNGCLLRTWHLTATHLGVSADAVADLVVRDYFSGEPIDAHDAWWVAGSDAIGPMGRAFVALRTPAAVEAFKNRHGGKEVFTLDQLDERLFKAIFSIQ